MRGLSLCSGIGALDLPFVLAGGIIAGQVEINPFCRAVLAQHAPRYWPQALRLEDMRYVVGTECGTVDIVFGGVPCQGNSLAGQRRGRDDPRNLWPDFRRILCGSRPRWALVENVQGLLSASVDPAIGDSGLFGDILHDLAQLGYDAWWPVLPARAVGAPHQRRRVILVAHSRQFGSHARQSPPTQPFWQAQSLRLRAATLADPQVAKRAWSRLTWRWGARSANDGALADGDGARLAQWQTYADRPDGAAPQRSRRERDGQGISQSVVGRVADGPPAWLDRLGWPGWPAGRGETQFAYEPPRAISRKGAFHRERIEALGNAVVWQQIFPVFASILAADVLS